MKRRSRGYTLIELMITISTATLLGLGVGTGMLNFSQRSTRENSLSLLQTNLRRSLQYIARDLQEASYIFDPAATTLANYAPTLTSSNAAPVLIFWQRDPAPESGYSPYQLVIYYLMAPPGGSSLYGPRLISRLILAFATANTPDTSGDQFLSASEALARAPSGTCIAATDKVYQYTCGLSAVGGATPALPVIGTQALVDRLASVGGFSTTVLGNRTALLNVTGDTTLLAGASDRTNTQLIIDSEEAGQLRQQLVVSMRNR